MARKIMNCDQWLFTAHSCVRGARVPELRGGEIPMGLCVQPTGKLPKAHSEQHSGGKTFILYLHVHRTSHAEDSLLFETLSRPR